MQRTYCKVPHWSHRTHGLECQLYCAAHPAHTPLVSLLPYPKLGRTTPNVFWVFFLQSMCHLLWLFLIMVFVKTPTSDIT